MFNMGFTELLLLGAIALIFIGPKQLPEVARVVARLLNELKRATGELGTSFMDVRRDTDELLREAQNSIRKSIEEKVLAEPKQETAAEGKPPENKPEEGKS